MRAGEPPSIDVGSEKPKVLVVTARGAKLRVYRRHVVVETRDGRFAVPVAEVDRIVLVTSQIALTTAFLRKMARLGIDLLVLDARGNPMLTLTPPFISRTSETRLAQYRAVTDPSARLALAKSIVRAKMLNQANFLRSLYLEKGDETLREDAERIEDYARMALGADSVERLRILEAQAARRYWGALAATLPPDLGFRGRDPDAGDDFNTMLNYLYALLYAWVHRYLVMYGLDPYVGVIHADRSGRPTLVYDMAELFRVSAVDRLAYTMVSRGWRPRRDPETGLMDEETRGQLVQWYSRWVRERRVVDATCGRRDTLEKHMARQARLLAHALRTGSLYTPFIEAVK